MRGLYFDAPGMAINWVVKVHCGVCSYQPLAEDKVSIARRELKEVLGKVPIQGIRTFSGKLFEDESAKQDKAQ